MANAGHKQGGPTSRYWLFTWNNYTETDVENILKIADKNTRYYVFGREVGESDTPHLQGFIQFVNPIRALGVKNIIDPIRQKASPVHIGDKNGKPSTCVTKDFAILYCKKGEQSHQEWTEMKTTGLNYGKNAIIQEKWLNMPKQGQRNDWHIVNEFMEENPDFASIRKEFPEMAIKYPNGIQKCINSVIEEKNTESLKERLSETKLFPWQKKLYEELQAQPHPRKIIWYIDKIGNTGKTFICKYLIANLKSLYLENGKTADIAHCYKGQNIITFDFTRKTESVINYGAIESIKNGLIFSPKYDSTTKLYQEPWVVCFSNFEPDRTGFSLDRWDIRYLNYEIDCVQTTEQSQSLPSGSVSNNEFSEFGYDILASPDGNTTLDMDENGGARAGAAGSRPPPVLVNEDFVAPRGSSPVSLAPNCHTMQADSCQPGNTRIWPVGDDNIEELETNVSTTKNFYPEKEIKLKNKIIRKIKRKIITKNSAPEWECCIE